MSRHNWMAAERKAREIEAFWGAPDKWPFNTPDHVFFAHVLHQIGASEFPDTWPDDLSAIRRNAHFRSIALKIREHCSYGRLVGTLQRSDGVPVAIPPHAWNNNDFEQWFATGKAPLIIAYDRWNALAEIPQCWVFMERAGVEAMAAGAVLEPQKPTEKTATSYSGPGPQAPAKRRSQEQERVRPVLSRLYPDGIPDRSVITDARLVKAVADQMGKDTPSYETVLRAADRKK